MTFFFQSHLVEMALPSISILCSPEVLAVCVRVAGKLRLICNECAAGLVQANNAFPFPRKAYTRLSISASKILFIQRSYGASGEHATFVTIYERVPAGYKLVSGGAVFHRTDGRVVQEHTEFPFAIMVG